MGARGSPTTALASDFDSWLSHGAEGAQSVGTLAVALGVNVAPPAPGMTIVQPAPVAVPEATDAVYAAMLAVDAMTIVVIAPRTTFRILTFHLSEDSIGGWMTPKGGCWLSPAGLARDR